jgi:outer membrane lipoprotein LolB
MTRGRGWLPLCSFLLLAACSARQVQEAVPGQSGRAYQQRSDRLEALTGWELVGRLSLDDGQEGGSGRLHWHTDRGVSVLYFRGALGRGAWRLSAAADGAVLERGDGSVIRAPAVDQLVRQEIGWQVPVDHLKWWVLGLRGPGPDGPMDLDEQGTPRRFEQGGWTIEFKRYQDVSGIRMPRRMEAVSGSYRVKLAISHWVLGGGASGGG